MKRGSWAFRNSPRREPDSYSINGDAGEAATTTLDPIIDLFGRLEVPDTRRRGKSGARASERRFLVTEAESGTDLYGPTSTSSSRNERDRNRRLARRPLRTRTFPATSPVPFSLRAHARLTFCIFNGPRAFALCEVQPRFHKCWSVRFNFLF